MKQLETTQVVAETSKLETVLTSADFTLTGGVYYSPSVPCTGSNGAIEITTLGTVTIQKAITSVWTTIDNFSLVGSGTFNLLNMAEGQRLRILSTAEVTSAIIIS